MWNFDPNLALTEPNPNCTLIDSFIEFKVTIIKIYKQNLNKLQVDVLKN